MQWREDDNPETPRQAENDLLQEQQGTGRDQDEDERQELLDLDDEQ